MKSQIVFDIYCRSGDIVAPLPDIQTRIEALSESVMDGSALNDFGETDSGKLVYHVHQNEICVES